MSFLIQIQILVWRTS